MKHTEVKVGQRVKVNNPEATIVGTVTDALDRYRTHIGMERYRFRVQWDTGKTEWLFAGELKAVEKI